MHNDSFIEKQKKPMSFNSFAKSVRPDDVKPEMFLTPRKSDRLDEQVDREIDDPIPIRPDPPAFSFADKTLRFKYMQDLLMYKIASRDVKKFKYEVNQTANHKELLRRIMRETYDKNLVIETAFQSKDQLQITFKMEAGIKECQQILAVANISSGLDLENLAVLIFLERISPDLFGKVSKGLSKAMLGKLEAFKSSMQTEENFKNFSGKNDNYERKPCSVTPERKKKSKKSKKSKKNKEQSEETADQFIGTKQIINIPHKSDSHKIVDEVLEEERLPVVKKSKRGAKNQSLQNVKEESREVIDEEILISEHEYSAASKKLVPCKATPRRELAKKALDERERSKKCIEAKKSPTAVSNPKKSKVRETKIDQQPEISNTLSESLTPGKSVISAKVSPAGTESLAKRPPVVKQTIDAKAKKHKIKKQSKNTAEGLLTTDLIKPVENKADIINLDDFEELDQIKPSADYFCGGADSDAGKPDINDNKAKNKKGDVQEEVITSTGKSKKHKQDGNQDTGVRKKTDVMPADRILTDEVKNHTSKIGNKKVGGGNHILE